MKEKSIDTDTLDEQIISALGRDGRISFKELARELGVADGTVRSRTTRLLDAGLIRVSAIRNPFAQERGLNALVGMELEKRTHRRTMEQIAALPGVLSVANVTGSYDLVVEVFLPSRDALNTFLFEELAAVEGIRSTETFVLLEAINKWIPGA
jgi:Lrp/AsnC family transcriptional regulator for asnA, asnC and gidA